MQHHITQDWIRCSFSSYIDHMCFINPNELHCPNSQTLILPLNGTKAISKIFKIAVTRVAHSLHQPAFAFNTKVQFNQVIYELKQHRENFLQAIEMGPCRNTT